MILVLGVVSHLLRDTGLGHGSHQLLSGFPVHEDVDSSALYPQEYGL